MRRLAFVLLAACTDGSMVESPCPTMLVSDVTYFPGSIVSGDTSVAVTWWNASSHTQHGAIVSADGTVSPEVRVRGGNATPGKTTALWHSSIEPLVALLQHRNGESMEIDVPASQRPHSIVFDGTSYQMFWIDERYAVQHRSISEAGVLGPIRTVIPPVFVPQGTLATASDGAGQTFLRFRDEGFLVDTTTGALERIFAPVSGIATDAPNNVFYFDGRYHIHSTGTLLSISPSTTYSVRGLQIADVQTFVARGSSLYVVTGFDIVELDVSLRLVRRIAGRPSQVGWLGDRIVTFEQNPLIGAGGVTLVAAEHDPWRVEIANDSDPYVVELCEP